jgi:predicted nucleic acid-binding protein
VLASALATRGLCSDVLRGVFAAHELLSCTEVLRELNKVLHDKFGIPAKLRKEILAFLTQEAQIIRKRKSLPIGLKDPADQPIIGAAAAGGADVFITGDKELQGLGQIEGLRTLSPRQFWELLRTRHG